MKNVLVISNEFYPAIKPTAKMALRIISSISNNQECHFDVISCSFDSKTVFVDNNITNHHIFNYSATDKVDIVHSAIRFFYKAIKKVYSFFVHYQFFDNRRFYNKGKQLLAKREYDAILGISGYFAEHQAAFKLSKKFKVPLFLFYADPFVTNIVFKKIKKEKLINLETKWFDQTTKCFLPSNYLCQYREIYKDYINKFCECELAGFFDEKELMVINKTKRIDKLIVYAGSFFFNWRRPDRLIEMAKELENYIFLVLGKLDYELFGWKEIPKNIKVVERLCGDDYLNTIGSASIFFLEDNSFSNQIPYKAFEYVSTGKPIIYSTSNSLSATSIFLSEYTNKFIMTSIDHCSIKSFEEWMSKSCSDKLDNDGSYIKYKTEYISELIWSIMFQNR